MLPNPYKENEPSHLTELSNLTHSHRTHNAYSKACWNPPGLNKYLNHCKNSLSGFHQVFISAPLSVITKVATDISGEIAVNPC